MPPRSAAAARPIAAVPAARARRARLAWRLTYHALLVLVACLAMFPIVWLVSGSLQSAEELYGGVTLVPRTPQFGNYLTAWKEGGFGVFLRNSLLYASTTVAVTLLVGSMAAYALARIDFRGRTPVLVVILAVMIVPLPASFVALYKLLISLGLANTRPGYVLALTASGLPISIFILRGFFVRQPRDLEDAAVLDGCSAWGVYWRVMLPLARPGLAAVAIIQFLNVWNEYLLALVMFSSDALMPVQRGLTQFVSADTPEQHILLAATTMAVLPVIVLYAFAQRSIIQGIMEGAVRG
jgi:raffinose/stachyose/melibiose transport system permease protein